MKKHTTINAILHSILTTKRPTNNAGYCLAYTQGLLDANNIAYTTDVHMNVTVDLGGTTCFTSHQDTVDNKLGVNKLVVDNAGLVSVRGGGVLGADCGAGMYIMIRMILAGKPGLYVFFSTEEQGRVGSTAYRMPNQAERGVAEHIKKCVSFDRKGTNNLITHQMGERGCSEEFADAFIAAFDLQYKKDPTGSYTDSYSFFDSVPECINLSVGYYNQHTKNEAQDVPFLERLVDACITMDWETLPVERDPTDARCEYDYWNWYSRENGYYQAIHSIEDFVYEHPDAVANFLEDYGITLGDLYRYIGDKF